MRRKHRRRRRNVVTSLWASLRQKVGAHALAIGALLLFASFVLFFYFCFVAPYGLRWRGIYDEVNYPEGYSLRGIDVSHHQGTIDWTRVQHTELGGEPISFVFVKATEGDDLVDKNFRRNFYDAREVGLMRGAYHYFRPKVSAHAQADHFLRHVRLEPGDLPPVLDIEETGDLSPAALRDSALVWLRLMERHYGVKPILYTFYKFKTSYLNTPDFSDYPYWIAHYYVDTLRYTGAWKFWQHTDRGHVEGIKGHVDINCYNGSMYDLRQLAIPEEEE